MQDHLGAFRTRYQHPDIIVPIDSSAAGEAQGLLDYFDEAIRNGAAFKAGKTIQIAWSVAKFVEDERGNLVLWEPGFDAMPVNWVRGIDRIYRDRMVQSLVCGALGVEADYPSLLQSGVAAAGFEQGGDRFRMKRDEPDGHDSGWLFARSDSDEEASLRSLYEIALHQPKVVPFLALPPHAEVRQVGTTLVIRSGDREQSAATNENLAKLLESGYFR